MAGGAAKRPADEIRRIDHADNLLAPVFHAGGQLQHALDDIGDENRILALPYQRFARRQRAPAANRVERADLFLVERGANRSIAHETLIAGGHGRSPSTTPR